MAKRKEAAEPQVKLDAARLSEDPLYLMETCLRLVPKAGRGLVPFVLNKEQLEVLKLIWKLWKEGKPVRIIILKARQLGMSTLMEGFIYWLASTHEYVNSLVLGHEMVASQNILQMAQRFAMFDARHDAGIMPMMSNVTKSELTFDNPDWRNRTAEPGLGSRIKIGTADNRSAGHSSTLQAFHGTEVSRWKRPEILAGVLNALSFEAQTFGCLESTAHGPSGLFYDIWDAAERGVNEWTPVFLSWKGRPEYRRELPPGYELELTPKEEQIQREHGLTVEELYWRRLVIASPACQGQAMPPEDVFREQYPLTPEEAFVSSGRMYFDMGAVLQLESDSRRIQFLKGTVAIPGGAPRRPARGSPPAPLFTQGHGNVKIWKPPAPGSDYVIGADISAGIKGGDWSVAYVMNRVTQEYVASYRAIVDPRTFAEDLMALGWFYNEAFIAPEANNIGLMVARLVAEKYARVCYYRRLDVDGDEPDTSKPGWYTTSANRKQMFAYFRTALLERAVHIWDPEFLSEARTFVVPEDHEGHVNEATPKAERKKHDDCIMAGCITYWVNRVEIAGSIRRPKNVEAGARDWKEAAMRREIKKERGQDDSDRLLNRIYDDHLGDL